MDTASRYRTFATREARELSARYEKLALRIADDEELLALIDQLPHEKRQPNLLFAAVRFLTGPTGEYEAFHAWVNSHWQRVRSTMIKRRTQTNEAGRCATLLPLLATLPQPLALIEVGASAGLCLYPDRYRYRYDGRPAIGSADSPVSLDCRTTGAVPLPDAPPTVAWRAGVDLNPLDVRDPDDVRWLESLVWPEQLDRLDRLCDAVRVARAEPPYLVRGDLNQKVRELVAQAPPGATPVVFHSAVLTCLSAAEREAFAEAVRDLPAHWISNEAPHVLPSVTAHLPRTAPTDRTRFVLALDERPAAFTGPHGQSLEWFSGG